MDRRKELIQQYKEMKIPMGVYQIKNLMNGKILIDSSLNLIGAKNRLTLFGHPNVDLVKDMKELGLANFEFSVLEELEEKKDVYFDKQYELKKLEEKWLEKLKPYGDAGYNKKSN